MRDRIEKNTISKNKIMIIIIIMIKKNERKSQSNLNNSKHKTHNNNNNKIYLKRGKQKREFTVKMTEYHTC